MTPRTEKMIARAEANGRACAKTHLGQIASRGIPLSARQYLCIGSPAPRVAGWRRSNYGSSTMTQATFPFSFDVDYIDWRGRDRETYCEGRYSWDGVGEPSIVSLRYWANDYDEDAITTTVYHVLDDQCIDDWQEEFGE